MRPPRWIRKLFGLRLLGVRTVKHYVSTSDEASAAHAMQVAAVSGFTVSVARLERPLTFVLTLAHEADPEEPGYLDRTESWCREFAEGLPDGHYDGHGYEWGYGSPPPARDGSN
jgi:hypothetical protein